jgi:hypothetical protein
MALLAQQALLARQVRTEPMVQSAQLALRVLLRLLLAQQAQLVLLALLALLVLVVGQACSQTHIR